jgi:predicted O-linked N-acetylglucosamine transferase (SPINDLY family)
MGNALKKQGQLEEAIAAYNKALALKPDYHDAYNNMGNALKEQGQLEEAIAAYNKALALKPDYQNARAMKLNLQARVSDWHSIKKDNQLISTLGINDQHIPPLTLLSLEDKPGQHRLRSENFAKGTYHQKAITLASRPPQKPTRLRIGYFSADFKEHPVGYLMAKVFEVHNRDQFEIFGYSLAKNKNTPFRQRLVKAFDNFNEVYSISDKDVALLARQDKIDIAIDLTGYTQNGRSGIFAYRAAPVQINYLGYPGTMGADFIDYIIADHNLIPAKSRSFYSEQPIYLPHHYMAQDDSLIVAATIPSRAELGLPEKGFIFCAINSSYKITSVEFDIWMRILEKTEGSILWLL